MREYKGLLVNYKITIVCKLQLKQLNTKPDTSLMSTNLLSLQWTEYEEQHKEATDWLTQTETLVQSFNKLQDSLEEKKNVLEQFQVHLQTLFDWQKELDRLNMKAQVMLESKSRSIIFIQNIINCIWDMDYVKDKYK